MSGAEEAEIETIRKHKQELLDDIKVRTILSLVPAKPSQICLHQGASSHNGPGRAEVLLLRRHFLCHDPMAVLNFRLPWPVCHQGTSNLWYSLLQESSAALMGYLRKAGQIRNRDELGLHI